MSRYEADETWSDEDDGTPNFQARWAWPAWRDAIHARNGHGEEARRPFNSAPPFDTVDIVKKLPAKASSVYIDTLTEPYGWDGSLLYLFMGAHDADSILSLFRGVEETILRAIYSFVAHEFADRVTLTIPSHLVANFQGAVCSIPYGKGGACFEISEEQRSTGYVAFAPCGTVAFPDPADRNVNMLPFIFGDRSSLPQDLQCYYGTVIEKCPYPKHETSKVGYFTVHESYVEGGKAQRRDGLRVKTPGLLRDEDSGLFYACSEHRWGQGVYFEPDRYEGGIYMASSVGNTSEVWDALVDTNKKGIVDRHGGCAHLRSIIGEGTKLKANQLVWMTDKTPHEALPQEVSGYRQFVRVVTSEISHYFVDHCTANPLVTVPDHVVIVPGNKFDFNDNMSPAKAALDGDAPKDGSDAESPPSAEKMMDKKKKDGCCTLVCKVFTGGLI